jgi:hypothetical protein
MYIKVIRGISGSFILRCKKEGKKESKIDEPGLWHRHKFKEPCSGSCYSG